MPKASDNNAKKPGLIDRFKSRFIDILNSDDVVSSVLYKNIDLKKKNNHKFLMEKNRLAFAIKKAIYANTGVVP